MEQTEIANRNKVIAEFMGWKLNPNISSKEFKAEGGFHVQNDSGETRASDQLLYNTSWDWLMPVVDKILHDHLKNGFSGRDIMYALGYLTSGGYKFGSTTLVRKQRIYSITDLFLAVSDCCIVLEKQKVKA